MASSTFRGRPFTSAAERTPGEEINALLGGRALVLHLRPYHVPTARALSDLAAGRMLGVGSGGHDLSWAVDGSVTSIPTAPPTGRPRRPAHYRRPISPVCS